MKTFCFCAPRCFGLWFFVMVPGLALLTGCGGGKVPEVKNSVSGKVLLGDKPVGGIVVFVTADGKEFTSPISGTGEYTIPDVPVGSVKVFVKPPFALVAPKGGPEMPKEGPAAAAGPGVSPPKMSQAAATSGLTYDVKAGAQTYDIILK